MSYSGHYLSFVDGSKKEVIENLDFSSSSAAISSSATTGARPTSRCDGDGNVIISNYIPRNFDKIVNISNLYMKSISFVWKAVAIFIHLITGSILISVEDSEVGGHVTN